jgi:hypothetical protein
MARSAGCARCVPTRADGFWQFKRVVQSGLAMPHEPAYADERSKDCEAKSASE